jgi:hypothetical protein
VGFDVKDELMIRYSASVKYWRRNGNIMGEYISYLGILRRLKTE